MLQAIDLTKRYDDGRLALDHVNLAIEPGELFCLIGPNGAGKSTTLNLFLGFLRPSNGSALIDGIDVAQDALGARARLAYLPDRGGQYDTLSARRNLEFFVALGGTTSPRSRADSSMALRKAGMPERSFEQPVHLLSSGLRQKLAIAIATARNVPNLLLDEPTAGLDPSASAEFMALLRGLRDAGRAILMCTHDLFRASEHADRIGILREGRLVAVRTRDELRNERLDRIYMEYMDTDLRVLP